MAPPAPGTAYERAMCRRSPPLAGGRAQIRNVTLARTQLADGQSLLAFNDFFIGASW